jgi:hypothetical protein
MKNILLTTTALVAFAGAAAADGHTSVSFAGEASVEFNSETGYATAAEMTATGSATLDNGFTASTSLTIDAVAGTIAAGSVSLSSDTASLTFGTKLDGAVFTAVGDDYAIGDDGEEGVAEGLVASITMGETTLTVSAPMGATIPTADVEVGVTTSAAGWSLGLGLANNAYAMKAAGTAGGATVGFGMSSDNEWDVSVAYPVGTVTVSAKTDEANVWEVGAAYAADGVSAGIVLKPSNAWEISAGYAADGMTVAASFTDASVMTLGATYDMGNGLTVGGGIVDTDNYAFGSFDLGGGANAFVAYTNAADNSPAGDNGLVEAGPSDRDIVNGTTVGVSFTF